VTEYIGNYDDLTVARAAQSDNISQIKATNSADGEKQKRVNDYKQRKEEAAAERKRKRQIENAESDIEHLETELAELNEQMTLPEFSSDYTQIMEMTNHAAEIQAQIDKLYTLLDELYD
jgi:ATP-binding cassette subfamily F protein 3